MVFFFENQISFFSKSAFQGRRGIELPKSPYHPKKENGHVIPTITCVMGSFSGPETG